MKSIKFSKYLCLLFLFLMPLAVNAETINITPNKVTLLSSPVNGEPIAVLFKNSFLSVDYKSEKLISDKMWLEVEINAWIWKKSTNIKSGDEKKFSLSTKENFRVFPGKARISVIEKGVELENLKVEKNWVNARLTGWIPVKQTNYIPKKKNVNLEKVVPIEKENKKLETITNQYNNLLKNLETATNQRNNLSKKLEVLKSEREKFLIKLKELQQALEQNKREKEVANDKIDYNEKQKTYLNELKTQIKSNNKQITKNFSYLSAFLIVTIISLISILFFIAKKLSSQNNESKFEALNKLIKYNIKFSRQIDHNIIKKSEENKSVVKLELEKRISVFQENLLKNLYEIQKTITGSLATFNKSQTSSFSTFNEKVINTLSDMNNKIIHSQNESVKVQSSSFSTFSEKVINTLSDMNNQIIHSQNKSVKIQSESLSEFRIKTSDTIENALKRTTDSLATRFEELRKTTDSHMEEINNKVENRLKDGFQQTNKVFTDIKDRLLLIDQAQQKISDLSSNVISLQETLDNKGARGAFGEIQLAEIVRDMIPEKYCKFQETLSNGKRPDCLIILPENTGNIAIDAKFPLENYKIMFDRDASKQEKDQAKIYFKRDIKKHIKDISEKYIIGGETANGAVMFIPSEAVFAEINAHHPDLVKDSQYKHVWMTSPSTLMALLTTARAVLADDERSKQAKVIHDHLNALSTEFVRFTKRMDDLSRHINMANEDVNKINITARKITDKFGKIERSELETTEDNISIDDKKK